MDATVVRLFCDKDATVVRLFCDMDATVVGQYRDVGTECCRGSHVVCAIRIIGLSNSGSHAVNRMLIVGLGQFWFSSCVQEAYHLPL